MSEKTDRDLNEEIQKNFTCPGCKKSLAFEKRHNCILELPSQYWHKKCWRRFADFVALQKEVECE